MTYTLFKKKWIERKPKEKNEIGLDGRNRESKKKSEKPTQKEKHR